MVGEAAASPSSVAPQASESSAASAVIAGVTRGTAQASRLTYGALRAESEALAGALAAQGVGRGDRVALFLPAGLGFVRAFFALQRLAAVPFALSPRTPPATAARSAGRVRPRLVLVAGQAAEALAEACAAAGLRAIDLAALAAASGVAFESWEPSESEDDSAFLQATSGTSGEARAAVILQRNALASLAAARERLEIGPSDVLVGWVPPWHDLGLLRFILGPVYCGAPCYLVPPAIRTLPLWLRTAAEVRATILGAPDFAYRLATRMVDPRGLDLSALRYATNGGEPVRQSTIAAFEERFGVAGVLRPGYGLAEATLGVTCLLPGEPLRVDGRGNVSCGRPFPGVEVRIAPRARPGGEVGEVGECEVGEGDVGVVGDRGRMGKIGGADDIGAPGEVVGEILVRGPGVFAGYFDAEEESREALREGWLHTGDIGVLDGDGHLYVLGRQRAMLKRGGAPLAPREVEEAAEGVPGVRAAVAVSVPPAVTAASEEIVVALEAEAGWSGPLGRLAVDAAAAIEAALGFVPESILVLAPRSLPRTANGKIQHHLLRRDLLDGALERRGAVLFDSRRQPLGALPRPR
jgi:acyl-CoA synthetase (AMP-forming)/AMP-acid ligase II